MSSRVAHQRSGATPSIQFEPRYGLLTVVWLGVIYWLSSISDLNSTQQDRIVMLAFNLSHAPIFAAIAFCWVKSLSKGYEVSGAALVIAFVGAATCAVLDEWHQSFVPGRDVSATDLLLDLAGISAMLWIVRCWALRGGHPQPSLPRAS